MASQRGGLARGPHWDQLCGGQPSPGQHGEIYSSAAESQEALSGGDLTRPVSSRLAEESPGLQIQLVLEYCDR